MKPTTTDINNALREIESAELPEDHPRRIARKLVQQHRKPSGLTQAQIDSGSSEEDRRQRFVAASVKWSKRSLLARILGR